MLMYITFCLKKKKKIPVNSFDRSIVVLSKKQKKKNGKIVLFFFSTARLKQSVSGPELIL